MQFLDLAASYWIEKLCHWSIFILSLFSNSKWSSPKCLSSVSFSFCRMIYITKHKRTTHSDDATDATIFSSVLLNVKCEKTTAPVQAEGKVCLCFIFREPGEERGVNGSHNRSHNFPPATAEDRTECVMGDDSGSCILKKTAAAVHEYACVRENRLELFVCVMNVEQEQDIWSVYARRRAGHPSTSFITKWQFHTKLNEPWPAACVFMHSFKCLNCPCEIEYIMHGREGLKESLRAWVWCVCVCVRLCGVWQHSCPSFMNGHPSRPHQTLRVCGSMKMHTALITFSTIWTFVLFDTAVVMSVHGLFSFGNFSGLFLASGFGIFFFPLFPQCWQNSK